MKSFSTDAFTSSSCQTLGVICTRMGWDYTIIGEEFTVFYPESDEDMVRWIIIC